MKLLIVLFTYLVRMSLYSQSFEFCSSSYTDTLKRSTDTVWVGHLYTNCQDCKIRESGLLRLELVYKNKTIIVYQTGEEPLKTESLNDSIIHLLTHTYSSLTKYTYYPSGQLKTEYKSSLWFEDINTFYYNKLNKGLQIKKVECENLWGRDLDIVSIKMSYKHYPYFIIGKTHGKGQLFRRTTLYFKESTLGLERLKRE